MAKLSYSIKYRKNEGLVMSARELINLYFYGVNIRSQDGTELSEQTWLAYIKSAQREIARFLGIKFSLTFIEETVDYYIDSWNQRSYPLVQTNFFVNKPLSLSGYIGTVRQIKIPKSWLSAKKSNQEYYQRSMRILPVGLGSEGESGTMITGVYSGLGYFGLSDIPNYYTAQYLTGFTEVPYDLLNVVGKLAALGPFNIGGDLILGAGIASMSIGVDGLSQSISSTSSATNSGYGARIVQYQKEIKETLKRLEGIYKGINMTVL